LPTASTLCGFATIQRKLITRWAVTATLQPLLLK